jgi:hypothetical protein
MWLFFASQSALERTTMSSRHVVTFDYDSARSLYDACYRLRETASKPVKSVWYTATRFVDAYQPTGDYYSATEHAGVLGNAGAKAA